MDTANLIEVDVDLTFGDLYRATLGMSIYVLRFLIGAIVIATALWLIFFVSGSLGYPWSPDAGAIAQWLFPFVIGAIPTALILIPLVPLFRVKKLLRVEGMDGKRHYVFSDEGIRVESRLANADAKWAAYLQARETRRYFLLYAAPGFANVVPKRFFSTDASIAAFRSLVRGLVRKFKLRG